MENRAKGWRPDHAARRIEALEAALTEIASMEPDNLPGFVHARLVARRALNDAEYVSVTRSA